MGQQNDKSYDPRAGSVNYPDVAPRPQLKIAREDETVLTRAVRYMNEVDPHRPVLREAIRSHRAKDDQPRSDASCDMIIDGIMNGLAKSTMTTGTDFENTEALVASAKTSIKQRFEQKPDRGYALGE